MELKPGERADRYIVEGLIGSGGMARVYRVRHARLGSQHALKLLAVSSPTVRERLLREGQVQGTLRHPNVVPVTDVVDVQGAPALVMDYVGGPTLAELLAARRLTLEQADALARGLLKGMAAAHSQGLIHRDLKPQNVLLDVQHGTLVPRIADFGLAKVFGGEDSQTATRSGISMGTPAYMAPEQVRDAATVGPAADVFSLGVVLWELLVGERLFQGRDTMELFEQVCHAERPDPRERIEGLPERMALALERSVAIDQTVRPQDAGALLTLWMGEATAPAPALIEEELWAPDMLVEVSSLSSHGLLEPIAPPADTGGTEETFGWDGPMVDGEAPVSATAEQERDVEDGDASEQADTEELARQWTLGRQLRYLAGGAVLAAPLLLIDLVLVFDSVWTPLKDGGPGMFPIVILGVFTWAWLARNLGAVWHGRDPGLLSWLLPSSLVYVVGALFTGLGAMMANQAIGNAALEQRWMLASVGSSVSLITELTGAIAASFALLTTATVLAVFQALRVTPLKPSSHHLYGVGLASLLGMGLWGVALYSGDLGRGPVLVWLSTIWATASCAIAASPLPTGPAAERASRIRVAVWCSAVLGTLAAAAAVNGQTALAHFHELAREESARALEPALAYASSLGERPWLPMLAWALAAGLSGAVAMSGTARPQLRPRHLLGALPVLLVLPTAWWVDVKLDQVSGSVLPSLVQNYVHDATGGWFADVAPGEDKRWSGAGLRSLVDQPPLSEGELIVVIDQRPVDSLEGLLGWSVLCTCEAQTEGCPLESCFGPGASLPITVVGADGATREETWRVPDPA